MGFCDLTCVTAFHPVPPMHGPSYGPCMGQKGTIMRATKLHLLSDRSIKRINEGMTADGGGLYVRRRADNRVFVFKYSHQNILFGPISADGRRRTDAKLGC